ncbi:MAG TPA: MucB/RseB C-terminal domain-containing protein [Burkholderiales bacterium]|nr:MucB/RseB C-terminal domain-containing protein [Burkholderiales bacterium]
MRLAAALAAATLASIGAGHAAQPDPQGDALVWLKRIAAAARQLNYSGTFVYQRGSKVETSRITHLVDATGEYEKLEALDGPPREVIRSNDQVTCYYPDGSTMTVDKTSPRRFPAVIPERLAGIVENYTVRKGGVDRVAGFDCQVTVLQPKDGMRYGHSYCAELGSGMPLRAYTFGDKDQSIELFAFTQISVGGTISRDRVKPSFVARDGSSRQARPAALAEAVSADTGWVVNNSPAGFRKILEAKRVIQGKPAAHIVYSDGLAAVSVFVEPAAAGGKPEVSQQGAISIYTRPYAENVLTILGETPAATVMQIGNSVSYKGR